MVQKNLLKQVNPLSKKVWLSNWHKFFSDPEKPSEQEKLNIYLDEGFKEKSLTKVEITYPSKIKQLADKKNLVRFLATELNNIVITLGTAQLGLEGPLAQEVKFYVEKKLPHLQEQIKENFGGQPKIQLSPLKKSLALFSASVNPKVKILGPRLGIDVGGTSINLVLVDHGQVIQSISFPSFQKKETFHQFINRLILQIEKTVWLKKFKGIGIAWIGDARNGKPLRNSAFLKKLDNTNNLMEKFPQVISKKFGVPIGVWGDIEALGCYLGKIGRAKNSWLIRLGTSVGGAYFDAKGNFDIGFHLVSRVIINMSNKAFKHNATGVRGMAQQYVGSFAFTQLLQDKKIKIPPGKGPGEILQKLLIGTTTDKKIARAIISLYSQNLHELIKELIKHYNFKTIILSGSPVTGLLGKTIINSVKRNLLKDKLKLTIKKDSLPQKYSGAFAVAELLRL
ncbi:MAG: ROK family protein [Patescibacteria group bacterium]|jgi:predicted NBD/HSP70 family sugar kinase